MSEVALREVREGSEAPCAPQGDISHPWLFSPPQMRGFNHMVKGKPEPEEVEELIFVRCFTVYSLRCAPSLCKAVLLSY
jgi:hypothetical protein